MSTPSDPRWTDLEDGVLVRRSRLFHMNSVVLADDDHTVLVDPGVLPTELDEIAALVGELRPRAITLVLTHAHWDHVLGRPWWPKARTLAHDRFAEALRDGLAHARGEAERYAAEAGERWQAPLEAFRPDDTVSGQRFLTLGRWRIVFRDAPGHDDSQLTLHLPEGRLLLAADMLSDVEIPTLSRPPDAYVRTLETLAPLAGGGAIDRLVPGHGSIASGADEVRARIARDLEYLRRLSAEVAALRERGLDRDAVAAAIPLWDDIERHADYAMAELHRENAGHAFDGLARH